MFYYSASALFLFVNQGLRRDHSGTEIYIVELLRRLIRSIANRTTGRASGLFFGLAKPITQS